MLRSLEKGRVMAMGTCWCHAVVVQGWQSLAGLKRRCPAASRTWRDEKVGGYVLVHKLQESRIGRQRKLLTERQSRHATPTPVCRYSENEIPTWHLRPGRVWITSLVGRRSLHFARLLPQLKVHSCSRRTRDGVLRSWPIDRKA